MVSPMVMNAYNAAYNAAFRSLRPNATVVPRSPGLAYVQTNEQSTFSTARKCDEPNREEAVRVALTSQEQRQMRLQTCHKEPKH